MKLNRILYRTRQFWQTLGAFPAPEDLELASEILTPEQMALFTRMQPSEQVHCLQVYKQARRQVDSEPPDQWMDLLVAALLHDVGKSRHPLRLWERVLIVLARRFFPERVRRMGKVKASALTQAKHVGSIGGWRRPFIIAEHHPEWGAKMAAATGVSPLAVALIRRHQNFLPTKVVTIEDQLLYTLQVIDRLN